MPPAGVAVKPVLLPKHIKLLPVVAVTLKAGLTITVAVLLSSTEQPVVAFVASMLKVVVDPRFPVGRLMFPPVPDTAVPIWLSSASFLNW